jgi:hypothetical protein
MAKIGIKRPESFLRRKMPGGKTNEETLYQDGFAGTSRVKIDFCG